MPHTILVLLKVASIYVHSWGHWCEQKREFLYTVTNVCTKSRILGELPKLALWLLEQGHDVRTENILLFGGTLPAY